MRGSSAIRLGRLAVGLAAFGAVGVLTLPLWGDALMRRLARFDAYADTYYVVIHHRAAGSWLAALLLTGVLLILWGRSRD